MKAMLAVLMVAFGLTAGTAAGITATSPYFDELPIWADEAFTPDE